MRDLALDPVTGDLALIGGRARLTSGDEAVAQRLTFRLGLWQGEYPLDQSIGIPYAQLLGRKNGETLMQTTLSDAASSCPGVDALLSFSLEVDTNRNGTVSLSVRSTAGTIVSLAPFVAGAMT